MEVLLLVQLLYHCILLVLPQHAKTRIDVFLNPNLDPRGAGYNVIQSKLAIGAGKLSGMGLLKGNQTQLGFLYPKTTDFIFAVIGEEMGFIIAGAVIILYVFLITKGIYVAKTAKDDMGSYIATGIVGIFLFHMIENIGDNGVTSYYWSSTSIYQLWRKFTFNQLYDAWTTFKY